MLESYVGKRFAGLAASLIILALAYFYGPKDTFPTLATTIGLLYAAFVGGQSYTDAKGK